MPDLAATLRLLLHENLASISELIDGLRGQLQPSHRGLRTALSLAAHYPVAAKAAADAEWELYSDTESRVNLTRRYMRDANETADLIEEWFASGGIIDTPPSLLRAIERECAELLDAPRWAVVTIGAADNFETAVVDLEHQLFEGLGNRATPIPPELIAHKLAMVSVPRIEGREALWLPVVLGHELAHIAVTERDWLDRFDLDSKFDRTFAATLTVPDYDPDFDSDAPAYAIYTSAEWWIEELICDAYAVVRFGPAALAALLGFLERAGATESYTDHPPGWFRARMMLSWLGEVSDARLSAVTEPWRELAATPFDVPDWAAYLVSILEPAAHELVEALADVPQRYDFNGRSGRITWIADRLGMHLPSGRTIDPESDGLLRADVVNAGWIAMYESCDAPVERLTAHSLECLAFEAEMKRAASDLGVTAPEPPAGLDEKNSAGATGTISAAGLLRRLSVADAQSIGVTPVTADSLAGAALDVRLGKRFIVFLRTSANTFEPLGAVSDPRAIQRSVERAWGETFVLHPGELVLAATLEYLALPSDVACQVITRSSYGRLGLITATAVMIHPFFHGCLTLELVNLGALPITLTPGERIAQLVFHVVDPPATKHSGKYNCPTGPEFSKVGDDADGPLLRQMRITNAEDSL